MNDEFHSTINIKPKDGERCLVLRQLGKGIEFTYAFTAKYIDDKLFWINEEGEDLESWCYERWKSSIK